VWTQPFVTMSDSQADMSGIPAEESPKATSEEGAQLTGTRLAHYRETLCAVKPLHYNSVASNTALILTRQQHIELLNVRAISPDPGL